MAIPRLLLGIQDFLYLGNLKARRDWGHARDYMHAAYLIVQNDTADDWVIGTGKDHSVQDFVEASFGFVGMNWEQYVQIDERYFRPAEVEALRADATKAHQQLGWKPETDFESLVEEMVVAELKEHGLTVEQAREMASK